MEALKVIFLQSYQCLKLNGLLLDDTAKPDGFDLKFLFYILGFLDIRSQNKKNINQEPIPVHLTLEQQATFVESAYLGPTSKLRI